MKTSDLKFLDKKDTYSLILSAIYASEVDDNYMLLSDLMYMLDDEAFKSFITLFEGQTIKIPSIKQFVEMLKALAIFTYHDIQKLSFNQVGQILGVEHPRQFKGTPEYNRLVKLISDKKLEIGGVFDDFPSKNASIDTSIQ